MATDWAAEAAKGTPYDFAPEGLRQQETRTDWGQLAGGNSRSQSPWFNPGWQTGGRSGSVTNAFNDDFYAKMYDQYNEERDKAQKNPNYVSDLFLRNDFTGIVGWDQDFKNNDPYFKGDSRIGEGRSFRVGDIYNNGERVGNVYDDNSGLSLEEANAMVAPHIFGDRAADVYKETAGDQQALKTRILQQGRDQGKQIEAYITRLPYEQGQKDLLKEWQNSVLDEVGIGAAGTLGGAAAGAAFGIPGVVVGAALGLGGTLLNMDEARSQAARAAVSTGLVAEDQGLYAAIMHGTSQWGQFANQRLNVFSNLVSGAVDTFTGNQGDDQSELRNAAYDGRLDANIALGVTGFADGLLQAASKPAMIAYTATMAATAGGNALLKATRDGEWDETTGSFHKYDSFGQRLAAAGSSAIDISQMMLPGLLRKQEAMRFGTASDTPISTLFKKGESGRLTVMGNRFTVQNQGGKLIATDRDRAASFVQWLAPSTAVEKMGVSVGAMAIARREGRTALTADDFYRAANNLENARVPWKLAALNGFGESLEEVAQTYLDGNAVGWAPDQMEVVQAAIAGFTMGAGMGIGARFDKGAVRADQRALLRANLMNQVDGREAISKETWAAMDPLEKARLSTPTESFKRSVQVSNRQTIEDFTDVTVTSTALLSEKEDAVRLVTERSNLDLPGDAVETMSKIVPFENVYLPSHYVMASGQKLIQLLKERGQGLQESINDPDVPTDENAPRILQALQELVTEYAEPAYRSYLNTGDTQNLTALNQLLREYWNSEDPIKRRAIELVFSRNPNDGPGSFQMLLPQVSEQMETSGMHGHLGVSQTWEKLLKHDNDGDTLKHQARYVPEDQSRRRLRLGMNDFASVEGKKQPGAVSSVGFLNFAKRSYENATLRNMNEIQNSMDPIESPNVEAAYDQLVEDIRLAFGAAISMQDLKNFRSALNTNPLGAKESFYRAIAAHSDRLFGLGDRGTMGMDEVPARLQFPAETNVAAWMEDHIQQTLEQWRDGYALRQAAATLGITDTEGVTPLLQADQQTTREVAANTVGQTLDMVTGGANSFRNVGPAQYNALNSTAVDATDHVFTSELLGTISEWYTTLTRLRPGTALDQAYRSGDAVLTRARMDLQNLARLYDPQGYEANPAAAMIRVANTPWFEGTNRQWQSDSWNPESHAKLSSTIGQSLLREAAEAEDALLPVKPGELTNAQVYAGLGRARSTLLLNSNADYSTFLTEAESKSLGEFKNIGSLEREYAQLQGRASRKRWVDAKKLNKSYRAENSMYRFLIDLVTESVNTNLSHAGDTSGKATGQLAKLDRRFHEDQVVSAFTNLHQISNRLGLSQKDPQGIIDELTKNTDALHYVLGLFTPEMRETIISSPSENANTQASTLPKWFFDLLVEPNAERAAMIYWNALFVLELDRRGPNPSSVPGNTWIALYESLDDAGKDAFDELRLSSTDVQSFVNQINKQFAFNRQPMLAWRTDTTMFTPEASRGGWQWSSPSAEMRQAIRDANKYLRTKAQTLQQDQELTERNVQWASKMLEALDNNREEDPRIKSGLTTLERMLERASTFHNAAMGPAGMREIVLRAWRGLDIASAAKGEASPATAQFSSTDARRESSSFGSPIDQQLDAILSVDAEELTFSPQMLTQPLRITTSTGAEIVWNPGDVHSFLELFTADDGAYQGLAWDMLVPSVWEENVSGQTTQQYLTNKDFQDVLGSNVYQELLLGQSTRYSDDQNNELFLSYVNSLTPDNSVVRLLMRVAVARTTGKNARGEMSREDYRKTVTDVANALREVAGLSTKKQLLEARDLVQNAALLQFFERDDLPGTLFQDIKAQELAVAALAAEVDRTRAEFENSNTTENSLQYLTAIQDHSQAVARLNARTVGQITLSTFEINWNDPQSAAATQAMLRDYIDTWGPVLMSSFTGDDKAALLRFPRKGEGQSIPDFGADNKEVWNTVAKAIAAHRSLQKFGSRAASTVNMPQASELEKFDPSFYYLADGLLSDEMFQALQDMKTAVSGIQTVSSSPAKVAKTFANGLLNRQYLGDWTSALVVQHVGAEMALDSSGSGTQVAIGGLNVQNYDATARAATRTGLRPEATAARQYSIPVADLIDGSYDPYSFGLDGEPWVLLDGASVVAPVKGNPDVGPALVIWDGDQVVRRIPFVDATYEIQGLDPIKKSDANDIRGLSMYALMNEADLRYQEYRNENPNSTLRATVDLQMFHPADKPAEPQWANSIVFDGTLGPSDTQPNIYSAWMVSVDGVGERLQRAALDSIKGSLAILRRKYPRGFDTLDATNLQTEIHNMAMKLMETEVVEDYFAPENAYRAAYRMVRDRLRVIGWEDTADGPVKRVFSTEQWLTMTDKPELSDVDVFRLSRRSLETLRGSTTGSGHARHYTEATRTGGEGSLWLGFDTEEELSRLPELGIRKEGAQAIGRALRASNAVSAERPTTYSYRSYPANQAVMTHRPFEEYDARVQELLKARAESMHRDNQIFDATMRQAQDLAATLQSEGRVEEMTRDQILGNMGAVTPDRRIDSGLKSSTLAGLVNRLTTEGGRLWRLDPSNRGLAQDGNIRSIYNVVGPAEAQVVPTKDAVWVVLDSFEGTYGSKEWEQNVRHELAGLRELGVDIILSHANLPPRLDAMALLLQPGTSYARNSAGLEMFSFRDDSDMQQTVRARKQTLAATRVFDTDTHSLVLVDYTGNAPADAEALLFDQDSRAGGTTRSVTSRILPQTGMSGYSSPGTVAAGARFQSVLSTLLDPERQGVEYLAEQALRDADLKVTPEAVQEQAKIIRPLLEKAARNLDPNTGWPRMGSDFQPGDLTLSVGLNGAIAITRYGYEPGPGSTSTQPMFASQDSNGFDGIDYQGIWSSTSIRYVGMNQLAHDKASVAGGTIVERFPDEQFGLKMTFESPLTLAGAKLIDENGKKMTGVPMPKWMKPVIGLLSGRVRPIGVVSGEGEDKKGATRGMVTNAQRAISVFGWDAGRTLANALLTSKNGGQRWSSSQWAALDDATRADLVGQVRALLESTRTDNTAWESDPETLANDILRLKDTNGDGITDTARQLLMQDAGSNLAEAQATTAASRRDLSEQQIEILYLSAVTEYLRGDFARVSNVLGSPGIDFAPGTENRSTFEMPAMLTEFIDVNPALRLYVQQDINARMTGTQMSANNELLEGWYVDSDWSILQRNKGGRLNRYTARYAQILPTGQDDAENVLRNNENVTQDRASNQQQQVSELTLGLDLGHGKRDQKHSDRLAQRGFERFRTRTNARYGNRINDLETNAPTIEEQVWVQEARYKVQGAFQAVDRSGWDTAPEQALLDLENATDSVYSALGLERAGDGYHHVLDALVRTSYRAWHDPRNPEKPDQLTPQKYTEALRLIFKNLKAGRFPVEGSQMPQVHADIIEIIADQGTWTPQGVSPRDPNKKLKMIEQALNSFYVSKVAIAPEALQEADGIMHSYARFVQEGYWPPSMFPEKIKQLLNVNGDGFVSSLDPNQQWLLERGDPFRDVNSTSTMVLNDTTTSGHLGSSTELGRRVRRDRERGKASGGLEKSTVAQMNKRGRELRSEVQTMTEIWKTLHTIRTVMPQLNPFLIAFNPADVALRRFPVAGQRLLTGSSVGFVGRRIRQTLAGLSGKLDHAITDTDISQRRRQSLAAFQELFGIENPFIDQYTNSELLPKAVNTLLNNREWRAMIGQESRNKPDTALFSQRDVIRQKSIDGASRIQDVTYGMYRKYEAQMYIEGILEYMRVNNPNISARDVVSRLLQDPLSFMRDQSRPAHEQAIRNIQNLKGSKQTSLGIAFDRALMPMAHSSNTAVNFVGNTALLLMKFRNFAFSSAINLMGLQGLDAAAAILMQSRAFKKQERLGDQGSMPEDYLASVLESADIADLFIRSGISHTGLFMAALAMNALGLGGDDEDERRRKRAQQLQGLGILYDPRDIANDFRNRDAIYLDGLDKLGLGALSAVFQTPTPDGQPRREPVDLHWTLKFFVAPALGMGEFLQTGDLADLAHGFQEAIGSMPLINTNFFWDAYKTGEVMYDAATNEAQGDPGSLSNPIALAVKTVGMFEKALIENAFINEVRSASDEFNRNPWALPEVDAQGNIVGDRSQLPEQTQMDERKIDDNPNSPTFGQVVEQRVTRDYMDGLLRSFTMNNNTAAFIMNLLTGQAGKGGSFDRFDMATAQTTLYKTGVSDADAESIVLSVWDPQNKREVLTRDGAERIIDSLHAGTIKASDPAFQNIFLTGDQRAELSDSLQKKIYMEGIQTLGLSEKDATQRMWDIWYGDGRRGHTALSDVVWSRGDYAGDAGIPWNQTTTYRELNTTFATGPDGKMWATGVARGDFLGAVMPFVRGYYGALGAEFAGGNLGVDEVLNSTDAMSNVNTGFRALTRVNENVHIPDDEDIIKQIKASTDRVLDEIKDLGSDLYKGGYGGGYRYGRGGGGGGGGGRSYANNPLLPFQNGMKNPYLDAIPQMYINNINVRRSDVRRERFTSERGRLNQWQ